MTNRFAPGIVLTWIALPRSHAQNSRTAQELGHETVTDEEVVS
jgi:hypothetical protein